MTSNCIWLQVLFTSLFIYLFFVEHDSMNKRVSKVLCETQKQELTEQTKWLSVAIWTTSINTKEEFAKAPILHWVGINSIFWISVRSEVSKIIHISVAISITIPHLCDELKRWIKISRMDAWMSTSIDLCWWFQLPQPRAQRQQTPQQHHISTQSLDMPTHPIVIKVSDYGCSAERRSWIYLNRAMHLLLLLQTRNSSF